MDALVQHITQGPSSPDTPLDKTTYDPELTVSVFSLTLCSVYLLSTDVNFLGREKKGMALTFLASLSRFLPITAMFGAGKEQLTKPHQFEPPYFLTHWFLRTFGGGDTDLSESMMKI